ncbi:MAG: hypothetical protein AB7R40_26475, partial [Nitrospiraceae bacterium]
FLDNGPLLANGAVIKTLSDGVICLQGERKVLHDILRACAEVMEAIDPESDEELDHIRALLNSVNKAIGVDERYI